VSICSCRRVCVTSMRSQKASEETRKQIVEAGQVGEGRKWQESLYNEQEKPDSEKLDRNSAGWTSVQQQGDSVSNQERLESKQRKINR
jgi:hypothetical protein